MSPPFTNRSERHREGLSGTMPCHALRLAKNGEVQRSGVNVNANVGTSQLRVPFFKAIKEELLSCGLWKRKKSKPFRLLYRFSLFYFFLGVFLSEELRNVVAFQKCRSIQDAFRSCM